MNTYRTKHDRNLEQYQAVSEVCPVKAPVCLLSRSFRGFVTSSWSSVQLMASDSVSTMEQKKVTCGLFKFSESN